jgi:hypothetical protein
MKGVLDDELRLREVLAVFSIETAANEGLHFE